MVLDIKSPKIIILKEEGYTNSIPKNVHLMVVDENVGAPTKSLENMIVSKFTLIHPVFVEIFQFVECCEVME